MLWRITLMLSSLKTKIITTNFGDKIYGRINTYADYNSYCFYGLLSCCRINYYSINNRHHRDNSGSYKRTTP